MRHVGAFVELGERAERALGRLVSEVEIALRLVGSLSGEMEAGCLIGHPGHVGGGGPMLAVDAGVTALGLVELGFARDTHSAEATVWSIIIAGAAEAFSLLCQGVVFVDAFCADFDFIDDEDLVGSERGDKRPEDGDRGGEDGHIEFQNGEDVYHGRVKGWVKNGNGSNAPNRDRDDTSY